jgi:hypothetical protein
MAKPMKHSPIPEPAAPPAEERWVALADGWYCGKLVKAGDEITHVGREQLIADDGQRVTRERQG